MKKVASARARERCLQGRCLRYYRFGTQYEVWHNGEAVAKIDRTGDDDGWLVDWWWTWVNGWEGLITATALYRVKAMGETALHKRLEEA